jgi:hypothetical protein
MSAGTGAEHGMVSYGMGNVAGIGLPANAGPIVLSIGERIIRDREKIAYLQDYIRQVCTAQTWSTNYTGESYEHIVVQ